LGKNERIWPVKKLSSEFTKCIVEPILKWNNLGKSWPVKQKKTKAETAVAAVLVVVVVVVKCSPILKMSVGFWSRSQSSAVSPQ